MAITFPIVPEISSGDGFKSSQLVALANGINARLVSGLCEPWRIVFYFYSALLQIRNPDGYLFPARGEFLEFYQHVLPSEATWPTTGPGDPAGSNLASTMPAFVFGADAIGLASESERISDTLAGGVPLIPEGVTYKEGTPSYYWELAKQQRGGYDPKTGLQASPSFNAARSHFRIVTAASGPHGKSWGGYAPSPERHYPDCTDDFPSFNFFFTPTAVGVAAGKALISFTGSCSTDNGGGAGEVAFIYRFPWAFVVVQNSGAVTYLDTRYYIEGPYSFGSRLTKHDGEFPSRVLNHFASQFRGTEAQRAQTLVNNVGFWTQGFFTNQYALAPAIGNQITPDQVRCEYPVYEKTGASYISAGTILTNRTTGATVHAIETGFVIYSVLVGAAKLAVPATIALYSSGVEVGRVTLTPDVNGDASDVVVLDIPVSGNLTCKTVGAISLSGSTGGVSCELAEILSYKPEHHDWCLVLRLSGATIQPSNGTDGSGINEESAKAIGDNYFRWGAIINNYGASQLYESFVEINTNAVMESARLLSKRVRLLNRFQVKAYAVEGGKSCLWFERFNYGYGLGSYQSGGNPPPSNEVQSGYISAGTEYVVAGVAGSEIDYNGISYGTSAFASVNGAKFTGGATTTFTVMVAGSKVFLAAGIVLPPQLSKAVGGDIFDDLGPAVAAIPSGELVWGRTYKASGSGVGYQGAFYHSGEKFTAVQGDSNYYGGGTVYESNGIRPDAEPTGYSREWVMGLQLKAFRDNQASLWKPGAFSDYFALSERCQFYPQPFTPALPVDLRFQFSYGSKIWLAPELPTSYRYAHGTNSTATADFYSSCRLYEPCLNVEKTENVLGDGNTPLVKVTLSGRLHATPSAIAAGDISSTYSTWNLATLDAETYRTDENGVRDFITSQNGHTPPWRLGDSAKNSPVQGYPDKPTSTCYPSFYFVKLVEKPYSDNNDVPNDSDSKIRSDYMSTAELYLRLMCEGCVDAKTTQDVGCATGTESVFDYTWPNACFDANQLPWVPALARTVTDILPPEKIRQDAPKGFGVVPLTIPAAEQINWLARICNLLTRFRVMLPMKFETDTGTLASAFPLNVQGYNTSDNSALSCSTSGDLKGYASGTPGDVATGAWIGYSAAVGTPPSCSSVCSSRVDIDNCPTGSLWYLSTFRQDNKWAFSFVDPNALNACQPAWSGMLSTAGEMLCNYQETVETPTASIVALASGTGCGLSPWFTINGGTLAWKFDTVPATKISCRLISATGTLHTTTGPAGTFAIGRKTGGIDPNPNCGTTSGTSLYFAPVLSDAIILNIPLA